MHISTTKSTPHHQKSIHPFSRCPRDKYKDMSGFRELIDFEHLYKSYQVSKKGKGKKSSTIRFNIVALEQLYLMKQQLLNRSYTVDSYSEFIITEPKRRVIKSGSFRDKVLQHCLCDYVLIPTMEEFFINDSYAGRKNKGTLFGLNRLSENLIDFYNKYGTSGYILKCDITKFFYSINHDILKKLIRKYFCDENVLWVCDLLIDSTQSDGLPLGNQSSQVFALIYLHGLDKFIIEDLGCKYYGRYTDDFYLLSHDKEYLKDCLIRIKEYLSRLNLTLNNKTEIVPMSKGIRFLGFHSYLTSNGKVIRILTGENKRQIKRRIRKYIKLIKAGKMSLEKFYEKYNSWKNHASHGNCYNLIRSMDSFVTTLLTENEIII